MASGRFDPKSDLEIAVAVGAIKGVSQFSVFGVVNGLAADVERDISKLATVEIPLPLNTGEALEIVSDNAGDTAMIEIEALGPNAEEIDSIIVELNGTTPVALPGLISRINAADSIDPDGYDGTLSIQQAGGGTVFAVLEEEQQQLVSSMYTVPAGKRWLIGNLIGTMRKSSGTDTDVVMSLLFKGFDQAKWRAPFGFGLQRSGDTSIEFNNRFPSSASGPVDIKLTAVSSAAGSDVAGWYAGLLIDE